MNHDLFSNMQKQMNPSPDVRAALSEKLAQPVKRRTPIRKYAALAACAALVIGSFSVYSLYQDKEKWMLITKNFHHDHHNDLIQTITLHSYVTVEDEVVYIEITNAVDEKGSGGEHYSTGVIDRDVDTGAIREHTTGDLPNGAYVGDIPVQEGAEDYQKLMAHFNGVYPDWYGGAYLDDSGWLVVQLVESEDPGDKSLELQVLDWTDDGNVMFSSCKYSLSHLTELMDQLNALPDTDPSYGKVMAGWGIDEEHNRIELTLTEVNDQILWVLAELDPDDDAILVQVGQRATVDVGTEDPAVTHVMPGGVTLPEDDDLIAMEPYYDGAKYDVENLPEELPQEKQPATVVETQP